MSNRNGVDQGGEVVGGRSRRPRASWRDNRLTKDELRAAHAFIRSMYEEGTEATYGLPRLRFTREEYWTSYQQWYRGRRAWRVLEQGGTGEMCALMWYHHRHRPGSREWRPSIIIRALVAHALTLSVTPLSEKTA